jgi:hypothetical protein
MIMVKFKKSLLLVGFIFFLAILNTIALAENIVIPIEVLIDGRSRLEFTPGSVQWHHLDFAAPGRHVFQDLPTTIGDQVWYPAWPDIPDQENRDCNCYSDQFPFSVPWDSTKIVTLQIIEARESVSIIEHPTNENGGRLVIEFDDNSQGGSAWYRINLVISDTQAQELIIPITAQIDGRSRLEFTPEGVRWYHLDFVSPGRNGNLFLPTWVNNNEWYPAWPDIPDQLNLNCNCHSDLFPYSPPWGPADTITLQILEGRENVRIIEHPAYENGGRLIVEFDDRISLGDAQYRINLVISKNQSQGLVFWNTLGSLDEVLHSRVGPDLELYDRAKHGPGIKGKPGFVSGWFDNALVLDPGEPAGINDRIRNVVLNDAPAVLNTEHGTVEAWYRQDKDPVPYERNPYRIFDGAFGLNQCFILHSQATDSAPERPMLEIGFSAGCGGSRVAVGAPISQHNGQWIHIAGVWDRQGINGTNETIRLYVNGVKVATTTDTNWGNNLGNVIELAGSNDVDPYRAFAVDNVGLWDRAHYMFSLKEDPRMERNIQVPVTIWPRQLSENRINRGSGTVEIIVLGSEVIDIEQVDPETIRWGGIAPVSYYFKDKGAPAASIPDFSCSSNRAGSCHGDGIQDLVLSFRIRDIRQKLYKKPYTWIQDGCNKVQIEGGLLPEYGPIRIIGEAGLLIR